MSRNYQSARYYGGTSSSSSSSYYEEVDNLCFGFNHLSLNGQSTQSYAPTNYNSGNSRNATHLKRVQKNRNIFNLHNHIPSNSSNVAVSYYSISINDIEDVQLRSSLVGNKRIIITDIHKVVNPYLKLMYQMKKEQKLVQFSEVTEQYLYHGTPNENVENICTNNFDWRMCEAHKFGHGVSFSPDFYYASHYCSEGRSKAMIVAKVLTANICIGHVNMILPLEYCDTSQKPDGKVIVKYDDNEFIPVYVIYYKFKRNSCHH